MRRRPGPTAFADAPGSRHHGSPPRLPGRAVQILVVPTPPVGVFPLLDADMALLDLVALRLALGVVAVSQRRVGIVDVVGVGGLAHRVAGERSADLALMPEGDPTASDGPAAQLGRGMPAPPGVEG